jgi:hypothetical protein
MMLVVEVRPAEATFPGKNGRIAYVGTDGHDREIYTIDPGGGHRVQVTQHNERRRSVLFTQRQEDSLLRPSGKRLGDLHDQRRWGRQGPTH